MIAPSGASIYQMKEEAKPFRPSVYSGSNCRIETAALWVLDEGALLLKRVELAWIKCVRLLLGRMAMSPKWG